MNDRMRVASVLGTSLLLVATATRADERTTPLPADGWWVRYSCSSKDEDPRGGGPAVEGTVPLTISLVGTTTEDGKKCRWVEIKLVSWTGEKKPLTQVVKVLVPEEHLLTSEHPIEHAIRGWYKTDIDQTPGQVRAVTLGRDRLIGGGPIGNVHGLCCTHLIIFPGTRHAFEKIAESKTIEYQKKQFTIPQALKGTLKDSLVNVRQKPRPRSGTTEIETEITLWTDEGVAPAVAAAKLQKRTSHDGVLMAISDQNWTIEEFGTDAKSEMAGSN